MSWRTIAVTDVTGELSPQELNSFNTILGNSTTPQSILNDVVAEVRGAIFAGGNQLDATGTVPDQFRNQIKDICLWRLLKVFPALKALQTDARKAAHDEARTMLKDISKKDSQYRVEPPAPTTALVSPEPVNSIKLVKTSCPQMSRHQTNGL